jgi:hypothetical protein
MGLMRKLKQVTSICISTHLFCVVRRFASFLLGKKGLLASFANDTNLHRYEMLAEPQRDITPEQATARLKVCGGSLYRKSLE